MSLWSHQFSEKINEKIWLYYDSTSSRIRSFFRRIEDTNKDITKLTDLYPESRLRTLLKAVQCSTDYRRMMIIKDMFYLLPIYSLCNYCVYFETTTARRLDLIACLACCVTIMCRNDELTSTLSWVGCLLTHEVLPDVWKLREWEFWEGLAIFCK